MNNVAVVCKLKDVRPHPNADRVQLATVCNSQVVVGLEVKEGDIGVYFPTDTCLGRHFAEYNPELLTYFGKNLRVRTQKFRGEESEGFWCHISHLPPAVFDAGTKVGTEIGTVNGYEICKKYINPATLNSKIRDLKNIGKKLRSGSLSTFQKHKDTLHLKKEWDRIIKNSRQFIWTVKLHGTSQRIGNALVPVTLNWWQKLLKKIGVPIQENRYEYLVGTRNVILGELKSDGTSGKDGFYTDEFRRAASIPFLGKLHKGEVVYYEVVGYAAHNSPIMAKVRPQTNDLKKLYGNEVVYSYGCPNGVFDIYVYRIAYQTGDGVSIDLTWDQVKDRCKELKVKHVPEWEYGDAVNEYYGSRGDPLKWISHLVEQPDPIDNSHPMEGVVLRVEGSVPDFYKFKSFTFSVLEGIVKDSGEVDLEEAS